MALFSRTWFEGLRPQPEQSGLRMSFCPVTRAPGHPPEHLFLWEIRVLNIWQGASRQRETLSWKCLTGRVLQSTHYFFTQPSIT